MIADRGQASPQIAPGARVAPTAHVIGDVRIAADCVVDHGAVLASSGPPVVLERGVVVMPGAVVRSVGGAHRPPFATTIGADSLVGPLAALAGCTLGEACYVATGVMVFHGAQVGAGTRLGAGAIVHTGAVLAARSRVGMRQLAVPGGDGGAVVTGDLDVAREHLARAAFFARAFAADEDDQELLHRRATALLRAEAADWTDLAPFGAGAVEPALADRLDRLYAAFNARAIDRVLAELAEDVDWPNAWEGGRVTGHAGVRDYWTRQWAAVDPTVEPLGYERRPDGRVAVAVRQTIRRPGGELVSDGRVTHVYAFGDGLVTRMDVEREA